MEVRLLLIKQLSSELIFNKDLDSKLILTGNWWVLIRIKSVFEVSTQNCSEVINLFRVLKDL